MESFKLHDEVLYEGWYGDTADNTTSETSSSVDNSFGNSAFFVELSLRLWQCDYWSLF